MYNCISVLVNFIQDIINNAVFYLRVACQEGGNLDVFNLIFKNMISVYSDTKMGGEIVLKIISKAITSQKILAFAIKKSINLDTIKTMSNQSTQAFLPNYTSVREKTGKAALLDHNMVVSHRLPNTHPL